MKKFLIGVYGDGYDRENPYDTGMVEEIATDFELTLINEDGVKISVKSGNIERSIEDA